jgi:signal transduction histidine kinase
MSRRHSVLVAGVPFRIGAADTDSFARVHADVREKSLGRTQTTAAVQKSFQPTEQKPLLREEGIRLKERHKERERIVQQLHNTLLQGFPGASMLLHHAVEQTSPSKPALSRALRLVLRAIDEGSAAIRGIHKVSPAPSSLEQAFSTLFSEVTIGRGLRIRIFFQGKPRTLNPAIQEQLFLIRREAIMNALRHSQATKIEVEIQYLRDVESTRAESARAAVGTFRALGGGWDVHSNPALRVQ